ncbi:UDP-N-acetylglucosamine 2-epimerase [Pricia sp.]|uniref:UDP-N-acetylglucosamine 2-epimerase n=1 Tax=Pricia sp. TaxID=2268138 RepID=UPI0035945DAC
MRKIAVVTGSRAEYGLLKPLLSAIESEKSMQLSLLVTGMHLTPKFGNTYKQIEEDGFTIDAMVEDGLDGDTSVAVTKAMGTVLIGFADVFDEIKPDILVVLGDRSEILSAVIAAVIANIPVAHIHGGETTEGAYDEYIRHALTKMSQLHFTSTETYRNRVIQLGEHPDRVFNVGAIGIDSIRKLELYDKKTFEKSISKPLDKKSALITFHPVTLENATASFQFGELLEALDRLEKTTLIFTKPNSDRDGLVIIEMIDDYVSKNPDKAIAFPSLGQLRYLSALQYVTFVIGNSSSGILEVPYFKIPTINIGDRQKGRLAPDSVIHCEPNFKAISEAISKSQDPCFRKSIKSQKNLYGEGHTTEEIVKQLHRFDITKTKKTFYDLKNIAFEKL